jgi:murein DD-endopeptidase MepM/ murein hydrolase activator NlpD
VMCHEFKGSVSRSAIRWALVGAATILMAGCSSDLTRFGEGVGTQADVTPVASIPGGSPFPGSQAPSAGTYAPRQPISKITSQPLGAPNPKYSAVSAPSPSLSRPAIQAPVSTAAIATPSTNVAGWKSEGGTPIVVAQGESASMLASRYGVPTDALLKTNGFNSASQVQPGARLVVPVYSAAGGSAPKVARAQPAPVAPASQKPERAAQAHPVAAPTPAPVKTAAAKPTAKETLHFTPGPAAKAAPVAAKPAAVAKIEPAKPTKVEKIATRPVAPTKVAEAKPVKTAAPEKPLKTAATEKPVVDKPAKQQVALATPAQKPTAKAAPEVDHDTKTASVPPQEASGAPAGDSDKPEFRWPARGRVIQGFKPGGNDGINIALPEGTTVKAAEGGVVAYAGSELKGYGNLVLIRHPNGFVSAYANNGDLSVKRGQQVKRGDAIAKSGQTGNVASPQLHFELRKGSTPVDPTGYLAGL